jgi:hypothetical protein
LKLDYIKHDFFTRLKRVSPYCREAVDIEIFHFSKKKVESQVRAWDGSLPTPSALYTDTLSLETSQRHASTLYNEQSCTSTVSGSLFWKLAQSVRLEARS